MPPNSPPTPIETPKIKVNGEDLVGNENLTHMVVSQTLSAAAHTHLRLTSPDATTNAGFKVGKPLAVTATHHRGEGAATVTLFDGIIVGVGLDWRAGRAELLVDAYDHSFEFARQTVIKTYAGRSASDVITELMPSSVRTDISPALSKVTYPHMQQGWSVHRMLTDLCAMVGAVWWMDGKKLVVKLRSEVAGSVASLSATTGLKRFSARFSSMDQTEDVTVRGWDMKHKQAIVSTKPSSSATKATTAAIVTPVEGAHKATAWPRQVAGADDADLMATGIAQRMSASVVSGRGECDVAPMVRPGCIVTIANVSTKWNGDYYVTAAEHIFGQNQPFITRFVTGSTEDESLPGMLAGATGPSGANFGSGLTIGIVTNNNESADRDNDAKANRVKVKFPYLDDTIESAWARVVMPGAGANRGLLIMPEIDDEVLVGFEHGDVRRPYVLGGLWNGRDAPPTLSNDAKLIDNNRVMTKSFTSRKGHVVSITDGRSADDDIIIVTLAGDKAALSLANSAVDLYHSGDADLSITTSTASIELRKGGDITIKGKNITIDADQTLTLKSKTSAKLEAGTALDVKAGTQLAVEGNAGVKVNSPAITEIKGSMVKVN